MPYNPHPSFGTPSSDTRIWRYVSLAKLVSLLHSKTLYFARSDRFNDPFEGSYPRANKTLRALKAEMMRKSGVPEALASAAAEGTPAFAKNFRRFIAISCWHMSDFESAALWDKYAPTGEAVAIESSMEQLIDAISNSPDIIYIGAVRYIDFDQEPVPEGNSYNPFLFKRLSFRHERELRAIATRHPTWPDGTEFNSDKFWAQETMVDGVPVEVDVTRLIQHVWVAPNSPQWFFSVVEAIVKQFGLTPEVCKRSKLSEDPFY